MEERRQSAEKIDKLYDIMIGDGSTGLTSTGEKTFLKRFEEVESIVNSMKGFWKVVGMMLGFAALFGGAITGIHVVISTIHNYFTK